MSKNVIGLIVGIVLIGVGSVICIFEFIDFEFINKPYYSEEELTYSEKNISIKEEDQCITINIPRQNIATYEIIYDESVGDDIVINYGTYSNFYDLNVYENTRYTSNTNGCKKISLKYVESSEWEIKFRDILEDFIGNLKEKRIYNYREMFYPNIEIVINPIYQDIISVE